MKSSVFTIIIVCGVVIGAVIFLNRPKTSSPPAPPVVSSPAEAVALTSPEKVTDLKPEVPKTILASANTLAQIPAVTSTANEMKLDDSIHKAVEALLSAKNGGEKHELFQQLLKSGQLDAAIAELKQRAANNSDNAQLPTTLGEAQLNKVRAIKEAGGDMNDMGILAMQADQSFNAALKIDPQNWEANFVKASTQFYWPADEKRDNDAVQRLTSLIDQQETMTSNPMFVQTYVALGNQYQKIGQPEKAAATWQLGLTKFPNDPTLLKKINGQ
jgi:tetratricopeptide (TPR) repeat protein